MKIELELTEQEAMALRKLLVHQVYKNQSAGTGSYLEKKVAGILHKAITGKEIKWG